MRWAPDSFWKFCSVATFICVIPQFPVWIVGPNLNFWSLPRIRLFVLLKAIHLTCQTYYSTCRPAQVPVDHSRGAHCSGAGPSQPRGTLTNKVFAADMYLLDEASTRLEMHENHYKLAMVMASCAFESESA